MQLASRRIVLDPAPASAEPGELEVLFLGHAPGAVRPGRLSTAARSELIRLGFSDIVDRLPQGDTAPSLHPSDSDIVAARISCLQQLPLPLRSIGEFTQLFPEAAATPCNYASRLAGNRAWLQPALEDFFHAGGRRAWVVVLHEDVDPVRSVAQFLPPLRRAVLEDSAALRGAELVALLSDVALVCCPDLERLSIPPATADAAEDPPAPPPPLPTFVPLAGELPIPPPPIEPSPQPVHLPSWADQVGALSGLLVAARPDVQLLLTAPFAPQSIDGVPIVDSAAVAAAVGLPDVQRTRLQPLFPYLRSLRYPLGSPCGVVAGAIAATARSRGIWRSVAGTALRSDCLPAPQISELSAAALRDELNLGVLLRQSGALVLDDERCSSSEWQNSAEIVRLVGWLRRQLTRLGEALVFRIDPDDPRPELALRGFGQELFRLGALDGAQAEDGFSVTRIDLPAEEGQVGYAVRIAPAYPIDQIVLTFLHTRDRWQVEVA